MTCIPILFILTTLYCNYNCDHCPVSKSDGEKNIDKDKLLEWLKKNQHLISYNVIGIEGGEPLIRDPQFYLDILDVLDKRFSLFIRSNGSLFIHDPEKWMPLFNTGRVRLGISFQLGKYRHDKQGNVFTKEEFEKYQEVFKKYLGEYVNFVYVLTDDNSSEKHLDELADLVRKYKVMFELNAIRKYDTPFSCYIPQYNQPKALNYILKKHRDIAQYVYGITDLIFNDFSRIPGSSLMLTPNCSLNTEDMHPLDYNLDNLEKDSEKKYPKKCYNCKIFYKCKIHNYTVLLNYLKDTDEEQAEFCSEMKRLVMVTDKIRSKIDIKKNLNARWDNI